MTEDLEKTSYQNLYPLMQHYSSLLFNGRVSIITVCVLLWAYILGVAKDTSDAVINIGFLTVTIKMLVALFAAFLIPMFSSIENAYFRRFLDTIKAGKILERKYQLSCYFSVHKVVTGHPFFSFYFLNSLAFSLLFLYMTWHLNHWGVSIALSFFIIAPFIYLLRTYRIFSEWARELALPEQV